MGEGIGKWHAGAYPHPPHRHVLRSDLRDGQGVVVLLRLDPAEPGGWVEVAARPVAHGHHAVHQALALVREYFGDHFTPSWRGRGWGVEFASGYRLWEVQG